MSENFHIFEKWARNAKNVGTQVSSDQRNVHPFDERNIHNDVAFVSSRLFDDGHYSQATFEAFKLIEIKVKSLSKIEDTGFNLMMSAFNENDPKIALTALVTMSEREEQRGFRHMFAGAFAGIRNPRGHDHKTDSIELCLDYLSVASVLLRALEAQSSQSEVDGRRQKKA